jgi:hypothetical protein
MHYANLRSIHVERRANELPDALLSDGAESRFARRQRPSSTNFRRDETRSNRFLRSCCRRRWRRNCPVYITRQDCCSTQSTRATCRPISRSSLTLRKWNLFCRSCKPFIHLSKTNQGIPDITSIQTTRSRSIWLLPLARLYK